MSNSNSSNTQSHDDLERSLRATNLEKVSGDSPPVDPPPRDEPEDEPEDAALEALDEPLRDLIRAISAPGTPRREQLKSAAKKVGTSGRHVLVDLKIPVESKGETHSQVKLRGMTVADYIIGVRKGARALDSIEVEPTLSFAIQQAEPAGIIVKIDNGADLDAVYLGTQLLAGNFDARGR